MKRTAFTTFVLSITLVFFSSFSAMGQEKPYYITIKAGSYTPTDDLDDADFDTGFNGELSFGHYFGPNFALEAGVGYFETDVSFSGFNPFVLVFFNEDDEVTVVPITLTVKALHPVDSFELYLGAGIGFYFANFEADISTTGLGNFSFDDDETVFGAHFLVGVNVNLTEVVFIGVEGKYIWTEEGTARDTVRGIVMEWESNLNGYTITGNLGFRF